MSLLRRSEPDWTPSERQVDLLLVERCEFLQPLQLAVEEVVVGEAHRLEERELLQDRLELLEDHVLGRAIADLAGVVGGDQLRVVAVGADERATTVGQ